MTLARGEREWALLVSEYNISKKKLESKRQALKILMGDLESCQRERDIYKNKIKQLQQEVDNYKKQEVDREIKHIRGTKSPLSPRSPEHKSYKRERRLSGNSIWDQELQNVRDRKNKTLSQLLCESREENKALANDFKDLRLLYREAQEDILLLRENLARQRSNSKGQGGAEDLHVRQNLIKQLESSHETEEQLERDLQAAKDEVNEISTERDHYREKAGRLNTQLNYILGADERRLVDIDAVLMENRYQKEQIKQLREEKAMSSAALSRYKNTFDKKKNRLLKSGYGSSGHTGPGHAGKQALPGILSELTHSFGGGGMSTNTASELQFLANSLSESLSEKDIALLHQRNTNRILGSRVAELEKKLKTLEVSGLWSLEGHRGYGSDEMGKLTPIRRSPRSADADINQGHAQNGHAPPSPPHPSPGQEHEEGVFLFKPRPGDQVEESHLVDVNSDESLPELSDEEYELESGAPGDPSLSNRNGDSPKGDSLNVSSMSSAVVDSIKGDSLGDSMKGDSPEDSTKGDSPALPSLSSTGGDSPPLPTLSSTGGDSPKGDSLYLSSMSSTAGDSIKGASQGEYIKGDSPALSLSSTGGDSPRGNSQTCSESGSPRHNEANEKQRGTIDKLTPTETRESGTGTEQENGNYLPTDINGNKEDLADYPSDVPDERSYQVQPDSHDFESQLLSSISHGDDMRGTCQGQGEELVRDGPSVLLSPARDESSPELASEKNPEPISDSELNDLFEEIGNSDKTR